MATLEVKNATLNYWIHTKKQAKHNAKPVRRTHIPQWPKHATHPTKHYDHVYGAIYNGCIRDNTSTFMPSHKVWHIIFSSTVIKGLQKQSYQPRIDVLDQAPTMAKDFFLNLVKDFAIYLKLHI